MAHATGNQVLASLVEQMFDARMGVLFSRLSNYFDTKVTWDQAIKEHRAVLRAVSAKDPDRARAAMRHHMDRAYKRFSVSWLKNAEPVRANSDETMLPSDSQAHDAPRTHVLSGVGTAKPKRAAKGAKAGNSEG